MSSWRRVVSPLALMLAWTFLAGLGVGAGRKGVHQVSDLGVVVRIDDRAAKMDQDCEH